MGLSPWAVKCLGSFFLWVCSFFLTFCLWQKGIIWFVSTPVVPTLLQATVSCPLSPVPWVVLFAFSPWDHASALESMFAQIQTLQNTDAETGSNVHVIDCGKLGRESEKRIRRHGHSCSSRPHNSLAQLFLSTKTSTFIALNLPSLFHVTSDLHYR